MNTAQPLKINDFIDAFTYVNEHYVYNVQNYPAMARLNTDKDKLVFALKHGLLHMLKSVNKIDMALPQEKIDIGRIQWLTTPDTELGNLAIASKKALLKMIVNMLSFAHSVGFKEYMFPMIEKPTDEDMIANIAIKQLNTPVVPTLLDTFKYFIEKIAAMLEAFDHTDEINIAKVSELVTGVYKSFLYWFDADWLAEFLEQIPSVMKK